MRFLQVLLLTCACLASLQSCKSDPNGPSSGGQLILARVTDSSLVDVSGTWKLKSSIDDMRMVLSKGSAQFYAAGSLKYHGAVQEKAFRTVLTKFNGVEGSRPLYRVELDGHEKDLIVLGVYPDSVFVGDCDPTSGLPAIIGCYTRVE